MNYDNNYDLISNDDLIQPTTDNIEFDEFAAMWAEEEGHGYSNNLDELGLEEDYEDNQGYDEDDITRELLGHNQEKEEQRQEVEKVTYEQLAANFEDLPADIKFNIAGSEVTKEDLVKYVKLGDDVKNVSKELVDFYSEMENQKNFLKERAYAVALESDLRSIEIKKRLNDPYVDNNTKGLLYGELQTLQRQAEMLNKRAQEETERIENVKSQATMRNIEAIKIKMAEKYTDWNDVREGYGQYLQNSGVNFKELAPVLSPQLADVFMKAMKYDNAIKKVEKETSKKLQQKQAPQRQRGAAPTSKARQQTKTPHSEIMSRINSGQADTADWFDYLED